MKRLKKISTIIISIIILNGCGGNSKNSDNSLYFDNNMSNGTITKKILEEKGLYSFQLFNSYRLELSISNIKLDKNRLINSNTYYYFNGSKFIKDNQNSMPQPSNNLTVTEYKLTDNGWKVSTVNYSQNDNNITFNENGYFSKDSNSTILSIKKLKGVSIKSQLDNSFADFSDENLNVKDYILEDSIFSKDTIAITTKTEQLMDSNITVIDKVCYMNGGEMDCQEDLGTKFYNADIIPDYPSSSPEIVPIQNNKIALEADDNSISFTSIDEFLLYFKKGGEHFLENNRYSIQFDENKTIYYFDEVNNRVQKPLTGKLEKFTLYGVTFYEMQTPKEYKDIFPQNNENYSQGESSIILIDDFYGKVGRGTWRKSNSWFIEKKYNNSAINDIKKAIEKFMISGSGDTIE